MGLLDDAIREHLELKRQRGASDEELQRAEQEALAPARREPGADPDGPGPPALEEVPGDSIPPPPAPEALEPLTEPESVAEVTELHPEAPEADQPTAIRSTLPDADEMPEPALSAEPPPPPPPVDDPVYADEYSAEPAPADSDDEDYLAPEPAVEAEPPGTAKPHGDPMIGHHEEYVVTSDAPTVDPDADPHGDPLADSDFDPDEVPVEEQLSGGTQDPDRVRTTILDDPLEQMGPPPSEEPPPEGEQDVLEETPDFLQETPEHDKLWFEQKPPRDFDFD
jgi:hypothetical protein